MDKHTGEGGGITMHTSGRIIHILQLNTGWVGGGGQGGCRYVEEFFRHNAEARKETPMETNQRHSAKHRRKKQEKVKEKVAGVDSKLNILK